MNIQWLSTPLSRGTMAFIAVATAIVGASTYYEITQLRQVNRIAETINPAPASETITALGRLEPISEVVRVSAPTTLN